MDSKKQRLLLEYIISSPDIFTLCNSIIKPKYFDPEFRSSVFFIKEYYEKYHALPDTLQIEAESGQKFQKITLTKDQYQYCSEEIESFCRAKAMSCAIMDGMKLVQSGEDNYGTVEALIKDALSVSLNTSLGLDYFDDPAERLKKLSTTKKPTSTGWRDFDDCLGGGLKRKEMLLFSANSGVGKSIVMGNLGVNFLQQGFNVLFVTLELSEEDISVRYDSMITGTHIAEWRQRINETVNKLKEKQPNLGKLYIKHMPINTTTASDIRAYLKEFELKNNFLPDMLIVDYIDVMATSQKISAENVSQKDKFVSEELYGIGVEYDLFLVTASQQNRSAVDQTNLNHSHIAGGISKINITDYYVSILGTDTMKQGGEIQFKILKARSSEGLNKVISLSWNSKTLRVGNQKRENSSNLSLTKKDHPILEAKTIYDEKNDMSWMEELAK